MPVEITPPGFLVSVHVPVAGNPFNTALPVGVVQVGCVTSPMIGTVGDPGTALITTSTEAAEAQPASLVTIKLYVPAARPVMVVDAPVPVEITPPGFLVSVHVPVAGKPFNTTFPVGVVQVGCVTRPITGGVGEPGAGLTVNVVGFETQPVAVSLTIML